MNLNHLTPKEKQRVVVEFSAIEKRLDEVLFGRNDDEDDDGYPIVKTAAGLAAAGGAGYGGYQLYKRGQAAAQPALPGMAPSGKAAFKEGFSNLKTGTKAFAGEAKETLSSMFKRLFKTTAKAA